MLPKSINLLPATRMARWLTRREMLHPFKATSMTSSMPLSPTNSSNWSPLNICSLSLGNKVSFTHSLTHSLTYSLTYHPSPPTTTPPTTNSHSFYIYLDQGTSTETARKELTEFVEELKKRKAGRKKAEEEAERNLARSPSGELCPICYAGLLDTTFLPCKHRSCHRCIKRHQIENDTCFFCKAKIESLVEEGSS